MPLTNFEKVVQNNLVGTFAMTQAVAQQAMIPQKRGSIVNIIAMILRGFPGMVHTGAARAGVDNMTKSLAVEWSPHRFASTPSRPASSARAAPIAIRRNFEVGGGRRPETAGLAEEVAHLVTYLASPAADFVTGSTMYIDGGASLWGDMFPLPDE